MLIATAKSLANGSLHVESRVKLLRKPGVYDNYRL